MDLTDLVAICLGVRQWGMPKPVKKAARKRQAKRPSADPNLRAHQMMHEHMEKAGETVPAPNFSAQFAAHMRRLGAKGGRVSGARRMTNLTDEQRQEIALKAATARWAKRNKR